MPICFCGSTRQGAAERFRLSAPMSILTLVTAICASWCVGEEPSETAACPNAAETASHYLPDDCRLYGQLNVTPILETEFIRNLSYNGANPADVFSLPLGSLGLKISDVDRVFFGARHFTDESVAQFVSVLFCKKAVDLTALGYQRQKIEVGAHTVYAQEGGEIALCVVDDNILLVGELDTIRTVLQRGKPARLPDTPNASWEITPSSVHLAVSVLRPAGSGWMQSESLPLAKGVLDGVEAIGMAVEFQKDLNINVCALCGDEKLAEQIGSIVAGLSALAQLQDFDNSQVPQFRALVDSVQCGTEGRVISAKMTVPSELVQLTAFGTSNPIVVNPLAISPAPLCVSGTCSPNVPYMAPPGVAALPPSYAPAPSCPPQTLPCLPQPLSPPTAVRPAYSPVAPSSQLPILKVADVIRLVEAGVSEEVVARFVRGHRLEAKLTVDDLILLTEQEADPKLIILLQDLPVAARTRPNSIPATAPGGYAPPPPVRSADQANSQAWGPAYPPPRPAK